MLGGRSGNRGLCAQPCRLPFAAPGGTGHDLSLKDLSFVRKIGQLKQAGVCSAKIEGRMKRPEYVAAAVSACRRAADGEQVPQALLDQLEAVFSRSGFTQGYLTGERGVSMFGVRRKEDVTQATEKVFASLRGLYRGENPRVSVFLDLQCRGGQLVLTARDREGRQAVSAAPAGEGLSPLSQERCVQQLGKTGGTPFRAESVTVPEAGAPCGVSVLNGLRREALDKLLQLRQKRPAVPFVEKPLRFERPPLAEGVAAPAGSVPQLGAGVPPGEGLPGNRPAPGDAGGAAGPAAGGRVSVPFIGHSQGAVRGGKSDSPKNGTVHGRGL